MRSSIEVHILILNAIFILVHSQQYDFAAEITRQCLVPDPVGLLDCVENKVDLPYLTSWVDCTNSLGENVATSADIINYRCKSVWEGKGVIPQVFYIKDCVIEKTGLPAKNVSAEVLGAYKECESSDLLLAGRDNQRTKSSPVIGNRITQQTFSVAPPVRSYPSSSVQYIAPNVQQTAVSPGQPSTGNRLDSQQPQQSSEYDFAAEITRQCLASDPVGLLDCVENKVDLPYLTSWVECTNSLGQNVATSADIINYRCKSVWEGRGVIPEVFYIKDCVIDKTGLPAREVSAKVLGAYKECERNPPTSTNQRIKTAVTGNIITQQILPVAPPVRSYQSSSIQYIAPNVQQTAVSPGQPSTENRQNSQQPQQSSEYDFAAEITRQCLVPDPVGLLDCVENKVDLPYLTSWVECTNSLGQNVATSADIINYRCKSVWEGRGVIPEVFYIKDCVIDKTGLPAREVSAKVLGAYKECERSPPTSSTRQRTKTAGTKAPSYRPQEQFGQRVVPLNTQRQQTSEYDFAAEISRQCRVPDPVSQLDCVENKVDLPYLSSWIQCTNSLGGNVATSADIVNYRCKSVWQGKGVIPEVFRIKDCVIEKTGLPAKEVSAKVLGAYKECENAGSLSAKGQIQQIKNAPASAGVVAPNALYGPPMTRQYFAIYPSQALAAPRSTSQLSTGQMQGKQQQQVTYGQKFNFEQNVRQQQPIQLKIQPQRAIQQTIQQRPLTQQPITQPRPLSQQLAIQQRPLYQQPAIQQRPQAQQQIIQQKPLVQQAVPQQRPLVQQQITQQRPQVQQQINRQQVIQQKPLNQQVIQQRPLAQQQIIQQKPITQQQAIQQRPLYQQSGIQQRPLAQQRSLAQQQITQQRLLTQQQVIQQRPLAQQPVTQQKVQKQNPVQQQQLAAQQKSVQQLTQVRQPSIQQFQKPALQQQPYVQQTILNEPYLTGQHQTISQTSRQVQQPNVHYYSFIASHPIQQSKSI